ncbi:MAG: hypothetical protein R3Y66_04085 [Rikenellaceae bacterium]
MKRYIFILAVAFITASCTKDAIYDIAPDVAWTSYLSTTDSTVPQTKTATVYVGDYAFFRDASIGAVTHEWEVTGNARMISDPNDLTSVVDGTTSEATDFYLLFEGSGEITVTLRNQFESQVTSTTSEAIESVYQEASGLWLLEKVYTIESYCDLAPGYTVYKVDLDDIQTEMLTIGGYEDIDAMELTYIELKQGEKLFFDYNDDSDYRSTSQTWTVPNMSPDEEEGTIYTFDEITSTDITGFTLLASRDEVSSYIPSTKVSVDIPISVSVVNNQIEVIENSSSQVSDNVFEVQFTESLDTRLADGLEGAFKVTSTDGFGAINNAYASKVEIVEDNKLQITFDGYENSDITAVELSYDATTFKINSADGNDTLDGFTIDVAPYGYINPLYFNFLGEADPDNSLIVAEGWTAAYIKDAKSAQNSYVEICNFEGREGVLKYVIEAPAANTYAEDGVTVEAYGAVKVTLDSDITPDITFTSGVTYNFKCQIYVESLSEGTSYTDDSGKVVYSSNNLQFAFDNSNEMQLIDLTAIEQGKWVEYTGSVTPTTGVTISSSQIRVRTSDFSGLGANGIFYIDAISLNEE